MDPQPSCIMSTVVYFSVNWYDVLSEIDFGSTDSEKKFCPLKQSAMKKEIQLENITAIYNYVARTVETSHVNYM